MEKTINIVLSYKIRINWFLRKFTSKNEYSTTRTHPERKNAKENNVCNREPIETRRVVYISTPRKLMNEKNYVKLLPSIDYRKIPLKPTETRRGVYVGTPCKLIRRGGKKKMKQMDKITEH